MARPKLLDPDTLSAAAYERVRALGADALTARGVADDLHCSTQAVYTACGSMDRLRTEVAERARDWVEQRLAAATTELPYLELGVEMLRMARDEPHLFQLARGVLTAGFGRGADARLRASMRADQRLADATDSTLDAVHDVLTALVLALTEVVSMGGPDDFEAAVARLTVAGGWLAAGVQARGGEV